MRTLRTVTVIGVATLLTGCHNWHTHADAEYFAAGLESGQLTSGAEFPWMDRFGDIHTEDLFYVGTVPDDRDGRFKTYVAQDADRIISIYCYAEGKGAVIMFAACTVQGHSGSGKAHAGTEVWHFCDRELMTRRLEAVQRSQQVHPPSGRK